jgi:arabinogalactan endo-1,4-beta-galactosidase
MQISSAFPSNYLKASDLQGKNILVKMDRTEYEMIGNDKKLILYFQGKEKGMVLNKTNANNIAHIYGEETDEWKGAEIVLFEAMVDFQGKTVPAIRVRAPQRKPAHTPPQTAPQRMPDEQRRDAMDDSIPF